MKILLIEDDIKTAAFVTKGLEEAGYMVSSANDGATGLQMVKETPFDLAIIDVMLPLIADHERGLFGEYASLSVLEGVAATEARVMFVHSEDDSMIPVEISYDRYHAAYANDPRFTFIHFEDRGHNYIFCSNLLCSKNPHHATAAAKVQHLILCLKFHKRKHSLCAFIHRCR